MTNEERVVVSIYTGYLMCDFGLMHKRIEELMGREVFTHELRNKDLCNELREKIKPEFLKLCNMEKDNG